jgi:hypothetical protein
MYKVVSMMQFTVNDKENGNQLHVNSQQYVVLDPIGVAAIFSRKPHSIYPRNPTLPRHGPM